MCTKRILRSTWASVVCAGSSLREMLKHKVSSYTKREDPDQNGRMSIHGEWMLFLKRCDKNEWVSLELSFSIEIHFCSKLSPNSVQLSATLLMIHIKFEQDRTTRLCDIEFTISVYSTAESAFHAVKISIKAHNSVTNLWKPTSKVANIYKIGWNSIHLFSPCRVETEFWHHSKAISYKLEKTDR